MNINIGNVKEIISSLFDFFSKNHRLKKIDNFIALTATYRIWNEDNNVKYKICVLTKISRRQNSRIDKNLASTKISDTNSDLLIVSADLFTNLEATQSLQNN
jgi:hypothetical protein